MSEHTKAAIKHQWERTIWNNVPAMRCMGCGFIWKPDMRKPSHPCNGSDRP